MLASPAQPENPGVLQSFIAPPKYLQIQVDSHTTIQNFTYQV